MKSLYEYFSDILEKKKGDFITVQGDELEAMKAIMSSIETGILEYEEKKSKK